MPPARIRPTVDGSEGEELWVVSGVWWYSRRSRWRSSPSRWRRSRR